MNAYKIYGINDITKMFEVLQYSKTQKIKIKNEIIEKYKNLEEHPDCEQDYHCRKVIGMNKNAYDIIPVMQWMAYYHHYHEKKTVLI